MTLDRRKFVLRFAAGAAGLAGVNIAGVIVPAKFAPFNPFSPRPAHAQSKALLAPGPFGDNAVGSDKAPVTIIEYASLTCPHCRDFHINTYPTLKKKYIDTGKVRLIYREFPLNDPDLAAYMLIRCADKSKFFPMIDLFFKKQREWAVPGRWDKELFKIAKFAGYTKERFDACLKNKDIARKVYEVRKTGADLNVDSTPTFFINGKIVRGNPGIKALSKQIDALLK